MQVHLFIASTLMGLVFNSCAVPGDSIMDNGRSPLAPPVLVPERNVPMIDDPDAATEIWRDRIFADSASQARQKCEQLAAKYTQDGGSRVSVVDVRKLGNGKAYECVFEGEV